MAKQLLVMPQDSCKIDAGNAELDLKRYSIKISMTQPYECVDYWAKQPDNNMAFEVLIAELLQAKRNKYFKIEVSEAKLLPEKL